MQYIVKIAAILGIVVMEAAAMMQGINGDTLIYSVGALALLGGAETVEKLKGKQA